MSNQKLKVDAQPKTLHVKKLINRALRLFKKYKVIFAPLCVIITCISQKMNCLFKCSRDIVSQ